MMMMMSELQMPETSSNLKDAQIWCCAAAPDTAEVEPRHAAAQQLAVDIHSDTPLYPATQAQMRKRCTTPNTSHRANFAEQRSMHNQGAAHAARCGPTVAGGVSISMAYRYVVTHRYAAIQSSTSSQTPLLLLLLLACCCCCCWLYARLL
jgi:hypothetical protein